MRKPLLVIGLLAGIVYACNQQDKTPSHLLTTGKLPTQVFSIDITKDTVLHTKNGALIRIPHGALSSGTNPVQLEIKEAYTMQDILRGGLTTTSNGQPLSSGGMIYINPAGDNKVTINQKISIAIPTPYLDSNMQVFKGEVKPDNSINWTDPKPMTATPPFTALGQGMMLFRNYCASCHAIRKDLTGPALGGVLQRVLPLYNGDKKGLYAFMRNPAKEMQKEPYFQRLKEKVGGVVMTSFSLSDAELDLLFAYIENESKKRAVVPANPNPLTCKDSCLLYRQTVAACQETIAELQHEGKNQNEISKYAVPATITGTQSWKDVTTITPSYNTSFYYQFDIEEFGWRNIDCLVEENDTIKKSVLTVRVGNEYLNKIQLYLIIPSVKVMIPGGLLKNKKDEYGFRDVDGTILLPQNTKAYIIGMGAQDEVLLFGETAFTTQAKQTLELKFTKLSKEEFDREITSLPLGEATIKAVAINGATKLRDTYKELENAEQLKPQGCECNLTQPAK